MGLEEVKKGLKKESDNACSNILREADAEKQRLMEAANQEIEIFKADAETKADALLKTIEKREMASANIAAKKHMLNVKKDMIDAVFDEAFQNLKKMPESERKKVISSLIKQAGRWIEVSTVYCSSKDKKLISGYNVKVDDSIEGIVCESNDGRERIDYTYKMILDSIRDENLKEIAAILF